MALTGELSDLSLAELIEFFCNQRKTGRIDVMYPTGPASFYLQSGGVVHAEVGILRGIEAVYYALTQANASFTFNSAVDAPAQTINQPWTSVVLEGLRRMDEGIAPPSAFPAGVAKPIVPEPVKSMVQEPVIERPVAVEPAPMVNAEAPLVSAFDEPQIESADVLDAEPELIVSAPQEVPAVSVPVVEAMPIVSAPQEAPHVSVPVAEEKPKPIVSAPKPVAPAPVMLQEAQADSVSREKKQNKKQKLDDSTAFDVERAGVLSYHPKPAPSDVSPVFAQIGNGGTFSNGPWKLGAIFAAVVLVIAVVGVPWGWYARSKAAKMAPDAQKVATDSVQPGVNSSQDASSQTQSASNEQAAVASDQSATANNPAASSENRPLRAKEEARKPRTETASANSTAPASATSSSQPVTNPQPASNAARKVTVTVTYDENGRVTQASGGDATALRIARQKRFPTGKGGSATVTIPIN
ncbi:MAG TPA: DUF4388 domain-containing protein [Pyrinomonadaceae bacterium]|nr:DUF4388 domain-containing protein [Pyrinomonadaceae bacterium]